ncbi:MAG: bifunctional nicotinamidase/pyrazinamidase [Spirochaetes bacterium]|nr:MAG: bifunctional nicotinamidase/pyrazinamidase [Spirochaetota bacterium]
MQANRKTCLIIVDLQVDFCPGGSLEVKNGDDIIPVVNKIQDRFYRVVATQDWHPENHVSFYTSHPGKNPFETINIGNIKQVLWPPHCIMGTSGADFHPKLDTRNVELIIRKGFSKDLDSYSGFFENDRKTPTGLEFYLKGLEINEIYICGLALDVCVFYTAMDGVKLGFKTYVIEDASKGVDIPPGNIENTKRKMRENGIVLIKSKELDSVL